MKMTTSNKLFKLPAKLKTTIYLLTATGLTFHAATNRSDSLPFSNTIRTAFEGVVRSSRAISTIAFTVADYKYSLHGLPTGSEDYLHELSEVHLRSASRILKLCETNKGFYIKAGQFVAAMRQVPEEYSSTLSSLQDQVIPCDFKEIKQVLTSNLGQDLFKIFISLDEQPIAAASIAQVHRAILRDNHEVAIKVQYPGLEHKMRLDTAIMSFLSTSIAWQGCASSSWFAWDKWSFSPSTGLSGWYQNSQGLFLWNLFSKVNGKVVAFVSRVSTDFIQEAKNSERTAENFRNNDVVRVPQVFWDFTTSQVLTMEFCLGCKVDDLKVLKEIKVNPIKVAKALVEVFAEMIFVHGFVHGDPHPGNILVSPEGQNGFSLVLLDHGTYRTLDEAFRVNYCQLWKALILLDSNKIQHLGEQFGVGKYSIYFPLIFTGRTINSKSVLGTGMSVEEKRQLKHDLNSLKFEDISSFMESLPPNFLSILRTDGLLRSIIRRLDAPQRIRLLAYAKYALYGLSPKLNPKSDFAVKAMYYRFKAMASYLQLKLVLETLELLSWIGKAKQFVLALLRKITGISTSFLTVSLTGTVQH
ncbi:hypothetical protein EZV62_025064 [Acer yangbiense]|uniref:ABC1 atypical kinase-like domain-containing protein n=1 Tax=Acer yangbiense TaxID=1000413 RepID=A0A5C7GXD8_9ROSI|nr:hypothetical protein EZV62_025064 [Acer yangbiense]